MVRGIEVQPHDPTTGACNTRGRHPGGSDGRSLAMARGVPIASLHRGFSAIAPVEIPIGDIEGGEGLQ